MYYRAGILEGVLKFHNVCSGLDTYIKCYQKVTGTAKTSLLIARGKAPARARKTRLLVRTFHSRYN